MKQNFLPFAAVALHALTSACGGVEVVATNGANASSAGAAGGSATPDEQADGQSGSGNTAQGGNVNTDGSSGKAPWPMLGQGPSHDSRSRASRAPNASRPTWELDLGEALHASPVIAQDGTIYAATEHALHAVSPAGVELWTVPIQYPAQDAPSPAIAADGSVYVKNGTALDVVSPSGVVLKNIALDSAVLSSPTITDSGAIYFATADGTVQTLSVDGTPKTILSRPTNSLGMENWGIFSTPAVNAEQKLEVIVSSFDAYSSSAETFAPDGASLGLRGFTGYNYVSSPQNYPIVGAHGATYVVGQGLNAFQAAGPQWVGSYYLSASNSGVEAQSSNLAVAQDGTLYIALHRACRDIDTPPCFNPYGQDGKATSPTPGVKTGITALSPEGVVKWTYTSNADMAVRALSVASDGTLYAAGHEFYRLSADGKLIDQSKLSGYCTSPIAIDDEGAAVFGTRDGKLHAR